MVEVMLEHITINPNLPMEEWIEQFNAMYDRHSLVIAEELALQQILLDEARKAWERENPTAEQVALLQRYL